MSILYRIKFRYIPFIVVDFILLFICFIGAEALVGSRTQSIISVHCSNIYLIPLLILYLALFYFFQVYRIIWRYSTVADYYRFLWAHLTGIFAFIVFLLIMSLNIDPVRIILTFFLNLSVTTGYRILFREFSVRLGDTSKGLTEHGIAHERKTIRLIVGAGEAGRIVFEEYARHGFGKEILGFIDDDTTKVGSLIHGKPVISTIEEVNSVIARYSVGEILVVMPSVSQVRVSGIIALIKKKNPELSIKVLPNIFKTFEDTLVPELEDVGISDLIGRQEIDIDISLIEKYVSGKSILVTGAGGSIGSELCKQLLKFRIGRLVAIGHGEHSIYKLMRMLNKYKTYLDYEPEIEYRIVSVTDYGILKTVFEEFRPDVVFHAAAHKHVPLMEQNAAAAFHNNVGGTKNVLELSATTGVQDFILISTDKAVNPLSVMGATKRVAEMMTIHYNKTQGLSSTIVRFGNVMGSRGSVIPLFREQIESGSPVTITHPDMTRFFMSVTEAVLLIINAVSYSRGGEIFVLNMGEQYRIEDVAKKLIRLYGYEPGKDIPIEYIGLRPGEKLYEELYYDREKLLDTAHDKIYVLNSKSEDFSGQPIERFLAQYQFEQASHDPHKVRELLHELIPEYKR